MKPQLELFESRNLRSLHATVVKTPRVRSVLGRDEREYRCDLCGFVCTVSREMFDHTLECGRKR